MILGCHGACSLVFSSCSVFGRVGSAAAGTWVWFPFLVDLLMLVLVVRVWVTSDLVVYLVILWLLRLKFLLGTV